MTNEAKNIPADVCAVSAFALRLNAEKGTTFSPAPGVMTRTPCPRDSFTPLR
jgi:hypothetical protein